MEGQESGARADRAPTAHQSYGTLLLDAAGVLRLRYVRGRRDTSLSPAEAADLANVLEGMANGHPDFDQIDPNEAITLAHRVIDDDHPELSRMWPRKP